MRNQLTEFADAINGAACKIFTDYGSALDALQTVALVAPPVRPVAIALSLGQWAAERNCTWDQDQDPPEQPANCYKENQGDRSLYCYSNVHPQGQLVTFAQRIIREYQYTETGSAADIIDNNGTENTAYYRPGVPVTWFRWCFKGSGTPEPDPDPPVPTPPPYTHVTEEGCELTVNFEAWGQMPDGTAGPIFRIEPAEGTRASGGIIGGCNFNPTIVYSPSGGGGGGQPPDPIPVPYPPDPPGPDGKPLWQKLLEAALAGAVSGLIQNLFDETDKKLDQLLECACPEKPVLAKHWRSIRFDSDETTARGNRRLSKLFRYRGISPGVVDAVADHWKDFRWTTGPVCVYHRGSPLGTPQVWAATADEGKRVIRHAGGEAGIDPDQVGEWGVGGSDNPRYGVSLEVGLFCVDGCWSATSRPGPSGLPEAAVVFPDPYGSRSECDKI